MTTKSDSNSPPAKRITIDININLSDMNNIVNTTNVQYLPDFNDASDDMMPQLVSDNKTHHNEDSESEYESESEDDDDYEIREEIYDNLIKYNCPEQYLDLMCDFYMQEPFGYKYVCLEFLYAFSYTTFTSDYSYIYDSVFAKYDNDNFEDHIEEVQNAIRFWFSDQHILSIKNKGIKKSKHNKDDNFIDYAYKIKNSFYILLANGFSVFNAAVSIFLMNIGENIYYFNPNDEKTLDVGTFRCVYYNRELFARLVEYMGVSLEDLKILNNQIWSFANLPNDDKYEITYDDNKYEAVFT